MTVGLPRLLLLTHSINFFNPVDLIQYSVNSYFYFFSHFIAKDKKLRQDLCSKVLNPASIVCTRR